MIYTLCRVDKRSVGSVICPLFTVCAADVGRPGTATEGVEIIYSLSDTLLPMETVSSLVFLGIAVDAALLSMNFRIYFRCFLHPPADLDPSLSAENSISFENLELGILTTFPLQRSCCLAIIARWYWCCDVEPER